MFTATIHSVISTAVERSHANPGFSGTEISPLRFAPVEMTESGLSG
ncbi:hypothetical protein BH24CHL1_BH24CHL1_17450 [soil metagenome]